jgi:DNA-binding CsgD family transcriptional regulator
MRKSVGAQPDLFQTRAPTTGLPKFLTGNAVELLQALLMEAIAAAGHEEKKDLDGSDAMPSCTSRVGVSQVRKYLDLNPYRSPVDKVHIMVKSVSCLIEDIYDAALDSSRWTAVLEKTAEFIDAFAVSIVTQNRVEEPVQYEHHFGVDSHCQRIYEAKFSRSDPRNALNFSSKAGDVFSTFSVLPPRDMRETQFYQEYIQPQGITDNLRCVLETSPVTYFGAFRRGDSDRVAERALRRMRLIVPHLKRAVRIGAAVGHSRFRTAAITDVLDRIRAGIFLLDARRRIVHANESGHALLARRVLVRTADGRLSAAEPDAQRALDGRIAVAGKADPPAASHGVTVSLNASDGERYVGHLLPLRSGERRRIGPMCEAVAALFVHGAAPKASHPCELVAARYKLTPMEVNVLFAIVDVGGVPEVAKALGIAPTTVKTHLLRVFAKTNTRRQADLVKLAFESANQLVC